MRLYFNLFWQAVRNGKAGGEGWKSKKKRSDRGVQKYPRNLPLETVELADARDSDGKRKPFRYRWMVPVLFWDAGGREGERSGRAAERALIARELIKL